MLTKKLLCIVSVLLIIGISLLVVLGNEQEKSPKSSVGVPEILHLGTYSVTLAWKSAQPEQGEVVYSPVGRKDMVRRVTEEITDTTLHEVRIPGLRPGTRYTYRVAGSKKRFQFQTKPDDADAFSFLVFFKIIPEKLNDLIFKQSPEFIYIIPRMTQKGSDPFASQRPYLQIFSPQGQDSRYLPQGPNDAPLKAWQLDWGGLRLITLPSLHMPQTFLQKTSSHSIGLILGHPLPSSLDVTKIKKTAFHARLKIYNAKNPQCPVAFVIAWGQRHNSFRVDDVTYLFLSGDASVLRCDVDVDAVRATFVDSGQEVVLKQPPIQEKITCEECRRLADKGAYLESVDAYRQFIKHHRNHYKIDDAYFAIAKLLDERLFQFKQAVQWYTHLVREYPQSALVPLAKQRLDYIQSYSDYDYQPLRQFLEIKIIELARTQRKSEEQKSLLDKVASVIKSYPKSNIAPVMQAWLASQLEDPNKSAKAYQTLQEKYPEHPSAREAPLKIGDIYYRAGQWTHALQWYQEAQEELPDLGKTIAAQIQRAKRNILRDRLAILAWSLCSILFLTALLRNRSCLTRRRWLPLVVGCLVYTTLLFFVAWLIYEQFNSLREIILLVSGIGMSAVLGAFVALQMSEPGSVNYGWVQLALKVSLGMVLGGCFFMSGFFLTLYHVYSHYLKVLGL
jgi:tetratricopeptide (TPR) repeat protein